MLDIHNEDQEEEKYNSINNFKMSVAFNGLHNIRGNKI